MERTPTPPTEKTMAFVEVFRFECSRHGKRLDGEPLLSPFPSNGSSSFVINMSEMTCPDDVRGVDECIEDWRVTRKMRPAPVGSLVIDLRVPE